MPGHSHIDRLDFEAHGACPVGALGSTVADLMDRLNANVQIHVASTVLRGSDVLEIGFGGGGFMQCMRIVNINSYTGVDVSSTMVQTARQRLSMWKNARLDCADRFQVMQGNAIELPFPERSFDIVVALNVIYYWPELRSPLAELFRVLQFGGQLVLGHAANTTGHDFAYATHHHPTTIEHALRREGFKDRETIGFQETVGDRGDYTTRKYYLTSGWKMPKGQG